MSPLGSAGTLHCPNELLPQATTEPSLQRAVVWNDPRHEDPVRKAAGLDLETVNSRESIVELGPNAKKAMKIE